MGYNITNAPSASWYIIDVFRHNDVYTVQIAYSFTSSICPVYIRTQTNGIWNAWRLFNPGTANTAQVLTGYTFSSANGVNLSGAMPNRGNLNWSGSNTTYSVPAGYYSGGTLDSRPSYTNGYNAGVNAGKGALSIAVAWCNSTYGINGTLPGTILSTRTLGHNGLIVAISHINVDYDCGVSINGGTPVIAYTNQYGWSRIRVRANRVNSNTQFNVMNDYTDSGQSGTIIVLYIS